MVSLQCPGHMKEEKVSVMKGNFRAKCSGGESLGSNGSLTISRVS